MAGKPERFTLLGFGITLLDGGGDAAFSAQRWRASPGAGGIPVHLHHRTEEAFYIIDGELALWLDDDVATHRRATTSSCRRDGGTRSGIPTRHLRPT